MNALKTYEFLYPTNIVKIRPLREKNLGRLFGIYPKTQFSIPDNTYTVESDIGKKAYSLTYKSTYSTSSNNITFSIINF